jgi:hypothetical protein
MSPAPRHERQQVVLNAPLSVDNWTIPAGTRVNSQMIFLNVPDGAPGAGDFGEVWTFDSAIIGVISDANGVPESRARDEQRYWTWSGGWLCGQRPCDHRGNDR